MVNENQSFQAFSGQVGEIIFGTVFLLIGLIALGIAIIRRGKEVRILTWLAIWSGMYGGRIQPQNSRMTSPG